MSSGNILIADQKGHFLIKMVGDVRVTLCISLNNYMQRLFKGKFIQSVTVDVTKAETVDSTTLGLLTRMSQRLAGQCQMLMICDDPDMRRLMCSMGLSYLFEIKDSASECQQALIDNSEKLKIDDGNEKIIKQQILDSHKALMELNDSNKAEFQDLVNVLESSD